MNSFSELKLIDPINRALAEEGYSKPTPIQAQTIPQLMAGRDVVGIAQTGTGKTAAFALPILHHLAQNRQRPERKTCRALVLSPTRELSGQIVDSFRTYGRHLKVSVTLAIGGVPIGRQVRAMANGVDILVATPGRLKDLCDNNAVNLNRVEIFVLDEADRMLDMGFIHDIRRIVGKLPAKRQNLFFSATMPAEIEDLARQMLHDPVRVAVTPVASTAERIAQRVIHTDRAGKIDLLADILRNEPIDRALIFTRTKHGADKVVRQLAKSGLAAEAIHGNKSQNNRERVLSAFRDGRLRTLVATDIAARGIDVEGISHVVNFDLPNIAESYVHRIGRTARAGAEGVAISFCDHEERDYLRSIERLIRMPIPATDAVTGRTVEPQPVAEGHAHREPRRPQKRSGGHRQAKQHSRGGGRDHAHAKSRSGGRDHAHGHSPAGSRSQGSPQTGSGRAQERSDGSIGSVAFMQAKPRTGGRRDNSVRTPR